MSRPQQNIPTVVANPTAILTKLQKSFLSMSPLVLGMIASNVLVPDFQAGGMLAVAAAVVAFAYCVDILYQIRTIVDQQWAECEVLQDKLYDSTDTIDLFKGTIRDQKAADRAISKLKKLYKTKDYQMTSEDSVVKVLIVGLPEYDAEDEGRRNPMFPKQVFELDLDDLADLKIRPAGRLTNAEKVSRVVKVLSELIEDA